MTQSPDDITPGDPFRINRSIPIALFFAVIVQTASGLVWVGSAGSRLERLERETVDHDVELQRLARLEEKMSSVARQLDRIEARLRPCMEVSDVL